MTRSSTDRSIRGSGACRQTGRLHRRSRPRRAWLSDVSYQFLSARSNTRTDRWGGSLEKRARFLLETITAIRAAVGPGFPIGLKLNSSDFMKGGFTKADAIQVVGWLNSKGIGPFGAFLSRTAEGLRPHVQGRRRRRPCRKHHKTGNFFHRVCRRNPQGR
jgi:hypothetical protein